MLISLMLSAIMAYPGASCPGGAASLSAFVGMEHRPARVTSIARVVPRDAAFQQYAIAFEITGSDHHRYLAFPQYRMLAPAMISMLSEIVGRHFKPQDAANVFVIDRVMEKRLQRAPVRIETCAALPRGKPRR